MTAPPSAKATVPNGVGSTGVSTGEETRDTRTIVFPAQVGLAEEPIVELVGSSAARAGLAQSSATSSVGTPMRSLWQRIGVSFASAADYFRP
jgi:hypothetical protein